MLVVLLIATSYLALGDHALAAGELEAAIKAYTAHLAEEPDSYRARLGLARATAYAGRWPDALDLYGLLLDENPEDPDARLGRGRILAWSGDYPAAETEFRHVTERYPRYVDAWSALGDVLLWSGRDDDAVQAYSRWIELEPERAEAHLARFRAQRSARRFPEARADLDEAEALGAAPEVVAEGRSSLDQLTFRGWEVGVRHDFVAFAEPRGDFNTGRVSVRRTFDGGSLAVDGIYSRRFGEDDQAVGVDGYIDLWARAYLNARAQIGIDAAVLPQVDARLALYHGVAEIWELSLGYRHLRWTDDRAHVVSASVGVNVGDWYLRQQSLLIPKGGEVGYSFDGLARFYFDTVDDRVELAVGGGRDVVTLGPNRYELRNTFFARLELQRFFDRRFGLVAAFTAFEDEAVPTGLGASLGFVLRFL